MQKTILIVEDNDDLRSFLKKVLSANNFKVAEAADGAAALESVEKYVPDLVLLDFGLPKVSGETVCVKIKQDHPEIIVIALTEKVRSSDVVHGLQIGADDYMSKPFVPEELIARIDTRFKEAENIQNGSNKKEKSVKNNSNSDVDVEEPEMGIMVIRESIVLVIIRLIFTETIFGFLFFLFNILFSYLNSFTNNTYLSGLYFIVLAAGLLINVGMVIMIALKWNFEYSEISKDGIIKHSGILNRKEQKYACNFVEAATLNQSFLGLLLNYGTIALYDPALKEQVYLLNIANPKKYSQKVQNIVSKGVSSKPMPFVVPENNQE